MRIDSGLSKVILVTGASDGIGLAVAKKLALQGHKVLMHGRNLDKLMNAKKELLAGVNPDAMVETYLADLSDLQQVRVLAKEIIARHHKIDVLINNAGIFKTSNPITDAGLDVRFVVNTLAPYLLMQLLMPLLNNESRVINLSSAAQSTVNLNALKGDEIIHEDFDAYAQSKLAITMWSKVLGEQADMPIIISVNPGSLLATKMVKDGFGMAGKDINIGVNILIELSLEEEHSKASGWYFDNDLGEFSSPHVDALDSEKCHAVIEEIQHLISK